MKRLFSIVFALAAFVLLTPSGMMAQDEVVAYVADELNTYYKELQQYDKQIKTAEDAERFESRYKAHSKLMESCYNDYSDVIRYEKKLRTIYENYNDLYEQLGKRIEELKNEKAKQERTEKVTNKLTRYLDHLTELEEAGNRCVTNKRLDSLNIIKKQAQECYVEEATVEYGANRDFIDEDENLSQIWKKIKDTYSRISILEIVKSPFNMTLVLEIVGILAAIALIVNMVSNKVKAAKSKIDKVPKIKKEKKKKQEEELPSI